MQKLDIKQVNNLITGNCLAVEIKSSLDDSRAFVVVGAYRQDGHLGGASVSKFLNSKDKSDTLFWFRKFEVKKEYIDNDWDVTDDELINSVHMKNIKEICQLENELSKYLDDYSCLDLEWKTDSPW